MVVWFVVEIAVDVAVVVVSVVRGVGVEVVAVNDKLYLVNYHYQLTGLVIE